MLEHLEVLDPAAVASLGLPAGERYGVVRLTPGEGGSFQWLADLHHDAEGAMRSMRYLAQKAKAGYDPADERSRKVVESIERHLATLEQLKTKLIDQLLPSG